MDCPAGEERRGEEKNKTKGKIKTKNKDKTATTAAVEIVSIPSSIETLQRTASEQQPQQQLPKVPLRKLSIEHGEQQAVVDRTAVLTGEQVLELLTDCWGQPPHIAADRIQELCLARARGSPVTGAELLDLHDDALERCQRTPGPRAWWRYVAKGLEADGVVAAAVDDDEDDVMPEWARKALEEEES